MSGRGRGRGGRGGRGAPGGMHPVAKDDEGKVLKTEVEGPPPVFPEVELPDVPTELPSATERQLLRMQELNRFWKASPFRLKPPQSTSGGAGAGDVERYRDRFRQQLRSAEQVPLTSILTLDPRYFPEELFSTKQQMAAKSSAAQRAYWAAQKEMQQRRAAAGGEELELGKLDELAKRESRQRVGGPGAEAAGADRPEGEGEEPPPEAEIDEEEDFMEDDDYYQNEHFDDDEGYDDGFDDGGDEGPVY